MIRIGDPIPAFTARTTEGRMISTAELRGRLFVIYFFPRAFTPGCTRETKGFRDEYPELAEMGVEVIGISPDPHDKQCEFAEWAGVPFPLVGDEGGAIARSCGVLWPLFSVPKRVTLIVDAGGIVRHVFHHEILIDRHVDDVRQAVATLLE